MVRNVIYFPYIRVPQSEWFTRVLLYWDQAASIVPTEYVSPSSRLGEYMHALIQEGLVIPIIPKDYINEIPHFAEAFLQYVDSPKYPAPKGILQTKKAPTFSVHMEKLGPIGDELCGRGLAYIENYPWYNIETYTANQFMAYLAATLGKLPELNSAPITDAIQNLASFAPEYHKKGRLPQEIDELRTLVLKGILPAPRGGIDPSKLAKFKSDYRMELTRFRNRVEPFLITASAIEDRTLRSEQVKQFLAETRDGVAELNELMKSKGWRNITVGRFLSYSAAAFVLAAAITTTGLLGVVAAAFGVGSAIYATIQEARGKDTLEGKYAAYAVLAQKKLLRV